MKMIKIHTHMCGAYFSTYIYNNDRKKGEAIFESNSEFTFGVL